MAELQNNLKTIIDKGVTLSKEDANRSYLFSSFKRTVSSWNSDLKKAKEDDTKLTKLMNTMQKDATKYLEKTKDIINNSLVKNPKLYNECMEINKRLLQKLNDSYDKLYNQINVITKDCIDAHSYYQKLIQKKGYSKKDINKYVNDAKKENAFEKETIIDAMLSAGASDDFVKNLLLNDNNFLAFIICYIKNVNNKINFTKWFEDEYKYLTKFDTLNYKEILAYQKHGAFIDYDEELKKLATTYNEESTTTLDSLYEHCRAIHFANKIIFKQFAKMAGATIITSGATVILIILNGVTILSIVGYILGALAAIPFSDFLLRKTQNSSILKKIEIAKDNIKILKSSNKPLRKFINHQIKHNESIMKSLIDTRPEKQELSKNKVTYMKAIKNNFPQKSETNSETDMAIYQNAVEKTKENIEKI